MVPLASLMCLIQTSFFALNFDQDSPGYLFVILCILTAIPAGFLLLARSEYPEVTFWLACILVALLPFDSLLSSMAMCSLLARRADRRTSIRTCIVGTAVAVWSQLRDALQPADGSLWHLIFAKPYTGGGSGKPIVMLVEEPTIIITAIITALVSAAIAILVGLHIRSRARLRTANAVASAATSHAQSLANDLNNQQLADAIAAEAHDTLAHSLSLLALNASALQAEAARLGDSPEAQALSKKAEDIRKQSAGALDEAHAIIDMLRDPQKAWEQLAPSDETALTRESLDALIADTRNSGMTINTWIDIQQLSALDESIGKVAFRALQESLTNALRHAPGAPVSVELTAAPQSGVHMHVSNPLTDAAADGRAGAGLPGLTARVEAAGGQCRYGVDDRRLFHVDVLLPWRS
ncbi:sensor histidine kinase [Bifidobacterium sp. LC6]|uniref:histidine kinase n=1 Tax=Bifidobacterium colobi TaxID=2809026 RepID=A0ABS5UWN6_9BIFI|nr:sensor histidine kinase [Bifidobacterium colobi]